MAPAADELPCRWILQGPAPGAWNMAFDEALAEDAATSGVATLRCYQWSTPTLSLGYFQPAADRERHEASRACSLVRRASGGGAILHDQELTYSLAIPASHPWAASAERLYLATHAALRDALAEFGVPASLRESAPGRSTAAEPFLCFRRFGAGDLLVGDRKVAGSAQRRHRGAILQHGSILYCASEYAPELPGIEQLTGVDVNADSLAAKFRFELAKALNIVWQDRTDWSSSLERAEKIVAGKFAAADWTYRR